MLQFKTEVLEIKELGKNGEIEGFISTYNSIDRGGDVMMPGAMTKSLATVNAGQRKIKMLWQHDPSRPIGVWDSFRDDSKGVIGRGRILTEVQAGSEALVLLKADAISGLSIGYKTVDSEPIHTATGSIRQLKEIDLWEASLVTFPMNTESTVTDVKNLAGLRDVEQLLRDAGVPNGFAKLVAKYGFDGATKRLTDDHRDDDDELALAQAATEALLTKLQGLKEIFHAS
jgi:HK97 family phage prohead protease